MRLFSVLPVFSQAEQWTKCSKPCDTGEQALLSDLTVKRGCNFESCETYDKLNLLEDGRMNDPEAWSAGSCKIEPDSNSYDQNGFRIFDRSAAYASIQQDHVCSEWRLLKFQILFSKVFIKLEGRHEGVEVVPRIQVSGEVNGNDYTAYLDFTSHYVPAERKAFQKLNQIFVKNNLKVLKKRL